MKRLKKVISMCLVAMMILTIIPFNAKASSEEEMKTRIVNTYNTAKSLKGVASFNGFCQSATAYQMMALGLVTKGNGNDYMLAGADGKNWYGFYSTRNNGETSKGYNIRCAGGANGLQDLINIYGSPLNNVLVSYGPTAGNPYGHVMFIHAVIGDRVYFTDSFKYGNSAEGQARVWTIGEYNQRYRGMNGNALGAVYFQPKQVSTTGWIHDGSGWKYRLADGSFVLSWFLDPKINEWYYFDSNNYMVYNCWRNIEGKEYYFYDTGIMARGWLLLGEDYYYMGEDGAKQKRAWIEEEGNRYYVGSNGKMYRNMCSTIDGVEYDFNDSGEATAMESEAIPETTAPTYTPPATMPTRPVPETPPNSQELVTEYSFRKRTKSFEYTTSEHDTLDGWELVGESNSYGKWGAWSEWSTGFIEASENIQVEEQTVDTDTVTQIYLGRYYSESKNNFSPNKLDSTYSFEGGWFDEDEVTFKGQVFSGGRSDCYTVSGYHYYFFEIGESGGETREKSTGSQTEYRYRERTDEKMYKFRRETYSDWSSWSSWSETPYEEDDLTEVRTREV